MVVLALVQTGIVESTKIYIAYRKWYNYHCGYSNKNDFRATNVAKIGGICLPNQRSCGVWTCASILDKSVGTAVATVSIDVIFYFVTKLVLRIYG